MSSILDFLNVIARGKYGRDVRQAIVDAISQCYQDGKAGVNDLAARQLIEQVMAVNEDQEADIAALAARIAELEGAGPSGGTTDTTTTTVPTYIIDTGTVQVSNVTKKSSKTTAVTFSETFTSAPIVFCALDFRTTGNPSYHYVTVAPILSSITTTGFSFIVANGSGNTYSPSVTWIAIQPTTVQIDTEIIVPATDDLTEAQIQSLIGLLN